MKRKRPNTDFFKLDGVAHWPSIEVPEYFGDAIIARLDSVGVSPDTVVNRAPLWRVTDGCYWHNVVSPATIHAGMGWCLA